MLNRAKYYHENDKGRLKKQARDKCNYLSEEKKNKKREYGKNRYHNMFEEKKERLKNIKKIIVRVKSLNLINKIVLIMYAIISTDLTDGQR